MGPWIALVRCLSKGLLALLVAGSAMPQPSAAGGLAPQGLCLARPFSDNAVLQRGQPCPIFGFDRPGTRITATFAGQRLITTAGPDGRWRVNLAPLAATRSPQTLVVRGSATVTVTNLLVGDVWLISGQSNADWPLSAATGGGEAIASATNSLIRYWHLAEYPRTDPVAWSAGQVARLNPKEYFSGVWQVNHPSTAGAVSAVGYFFARHIATNQSVPVGLIDCTVGGTPIISWIPMPAIHANPRLKTIADHYLDSEMVPAFVRQRLLQNLAIWDRSGRPAPMPEHPYKPGACWQNGLALVVPFALRGVVWYQGETDADFTNPNDFDLLARWHTDAFMTLVKAWRSAWEQPELPIYFVQLPQLNRPSWPWFRESQLECARLVPHTAMAVAYDCGLPNNVHPPDKQPVAERLALLARRHSYGEALESSGPALRAWRVSATSVILEFDHANGGLVSADAEPLRLFEIAGANRRFFAAAAVISNALVIVSTPRVHEPVAVRYAWSPSGKVNFFNRAGLPASPFRTDRWPAVDRPLRVACIGDSITFGYGLSSTNDSYPARLQAMLGAGYDVRNFGKNGATVTRDSFSHWAQGYVKQPEYTNALAFQPDIVVCNLGINDVSSFADAHRQNLVHDYGEIISAFQSLRTVPRIVVWHPLAPIFPGQTYYAKPVVERVNDLICQVATRYGAETLDLCTPLLQHPEWFPDKLHPNRDGARRIAETVAHCLLPEVDPSVSPPAPGN